MEWQDFLKAIADKYDLSVEEKDTFLLRMDGNTESETASQLNVSVSTVKSRMGSVYDKFVESCPKLQNKTREKETILRQFLKKEYDQQFPKIKPIGSNKPNPTEKFKSLIEEKTRRFVGRKFVFKGFQEFLNSYDRGYFTLIANPGEGKSAIASKYVKDNPNCIYYFNVRSDSQNRADQFLENVCQQLMIRYNLGDSLPSRSTDDGYFFKDLLQQVSEKLSGNDKLIIVVDALDEVDFNSHQEGANILYLPRYLPQGVYFFLTRRDEEAVKSRLLVEAPERLFYLRDYFEESKRDIREYVRLLVTHDPEYKDKLNQWVDKQNISREIFINTLTEKSENNFMYLRCVLPQIAEGYYQDLQLEYLPQGLVNYYRDHWGRMKMDRIKINIVYLLTVIRRPISRRLIAKFATVGELKVTEYKVQDVLREWRQFLTDVKVDDELRYKVYHASFADFLQSHEMVQVAGVEICNIHGLITDTLWQELYGDDEDETP